MSDQILPFDKDKCLEILNSRRDWESTVSDRMLCQCGRAEILFDADISWCFECDYDRRAMRAGRLWDLANGLSKPQREKIQMLTEHCKDLDARLLKAHSEIIDTLPREFHDDFCLDFVQDWNARDDEMELVEYADGEVCIETRFLMFWDYLGLSREEAVGRARTEAW